MTDHMQAAIEAAAKALNVLAVEQGALDDWEQWEDEAEATLEAVVPHLRAMIAQEVRAEIKRQGTATNRDQNLYLEGLGHAAQIAEGPQQ